jgi:hypothetical protein
MNDPRFAESLLMEIGRLGQARGLPQLDWRAIDAEELPLMEGAPLPGADDETCIAWAQSLEMEEYQFDGEGHRSWFLLGDRWTIEISTLPHPTS